MHGGVETYAEEDAQGKSLNDGGILFASFYELFVCEGVVIIDIHIPEDFVHALCGHGRPAQVSSSLTRRERWTDLFWSIFVIW